MQYLIATIAHVHHWGFFPWFPFLWFGLLAIIAFFVSRRFRRHRGWAHGPEATLGQLYAKGEITETEYRSRLTVLREQP